MNVQMFYGRKRAKVTQSGNQTILIHGKSGTREVPIKVDDDGKLEVLVHGRDGDNLVPIKVSEDGYLMLATEGVTVDLGTVELNQGAPGQNPWPVTLSGNNAPFPAIRKATLAERPPADSVPVGTTFTLTNENLDTWISDGTNWVEV